MPHDPVLVAMTPATAWVLTAAGCLGRGMSRTWLSAEQPWEG